MRLQDSRADQRLAAFNTEADLRQHSNSNTAGELRHDVTADVPAGARASDRQVKQVTTQTFNKRLTNVFMPNIQIVRGM